MDAYILPFQSSEASLARAGGKGANLARLVQAGFPVPGGFILTTEAYQAFVESNQLQVRILALVNSVSSDALGRLESVSVELREMFERASLPTGITKQISTAYHSLGAAPALAVAVRSSATTEDLPGLAFAGQQDTYLNIIGEQAVLDSVKKCWASLWTARAIVYRIRSHIPPDDIALAVVVQQMILSDTAGIAFTANPVTGRRDEIVIDASFGLGEALVSGEVNPDHYTVSPQDWTISERRLGAKQVAILANTEGGTRRTENAVADRQALSDQKIIELAQAAQRVANYFGSPQDIEWAWANENLYLLQARPITSLYPLPESITADHGLRVYVNFNGIQGINEPLTPLGLDALRLVFSGVFKLLHVQSSVSQVLPDAGGRLFLDVTGLVGDGFLRRFILSLLAGTDPGAGQTLRRLIDQGRFIRKRILTPWRLIILLRAVLPILRRVLVALLNPDSVRSQVMTASDQFLAEARQHSQSAHSLAACLQAMEHDLEGAERISLTIMPMALPAYAFMPVVDRWLVRWLGEPQGAALQLMRGLPGNVTIEMDLNLWEVAQTIQADPSALELFRSSSAEKLVDDYRQHRLPATIQDALQTFLEHYGMRGPGELDLGRARWREDPTPVIHSLLGYVELKDPALAPDVIFRRGLQEADRLAAEYVNRVHNMLFGWLRARILSAMIRRMRSLGGLREIPLFYLVRVNDLYRTALMASAADIVAQRQVERAEDIFYVPLDKLMQFARGDRIDLKSITAAKRANYDHEYARKQMPRVLLGTGEAFYEGVRSISDGESNNRLVGEGVSPGIAEGRVRVVLDPHGVRLEPGDILVCPSTNPGWTPLFLSAGALIMEIGGLMTHGSIVAREYGIPAVVGVHNATSRLKAGQHVRVDGSQGVVIVLDSQERMESRP